MQTFTGQIPLSFNRINSGRSIPTIIRERFTNDSCRVSIVSIQADQSRLACGELMLLHAISQVSIVSIQADQSRHISGSFFFLFSLFGFNRINSGRSIPTCNLVICWSTWNMVFQSYQFRQINPDISKVGSMCRWLNGFNRINSGRSIPTAKYLLKPDGTYSGFNRINSGRSIPTATSGKPVVARFSEAEWRNLFF